MYYFRILYYIVLYAVAGYCTIGYYIRFKGTIVCYFFTIKVLNTLKYLYSYYYTAPYGI